ncbi:MAG: M20/M25/M40 family metallo-hydrolase [Flavobacteriaceae bacterium]|nr:M20/M25/M40 family metallo-hydrolase [Flavobacteriaceae bacterium]MCY4215595.1 M20/M25/M40 family metallo-hydrolase [Flavobacteriaceae bacterium]
MNPNKTIKFLQDLIRIPSFSKLEDKTAHRIERWFIEHQIPFNRSHNNVWATNKYFDANKPNLLLNSHHDTVKPNQGYTRDPYEPKIENGKLYGLGSNDAGGALVSLISTFTHFYDHKNLNHNVIIAASAEEEISGQNSLKGLLKYLPKIDVALVGEPTLLKLAVAERGCLVVHIKIHGTPSHAAHPNEDNPIYKIPAFLDLARNITFNKTSSLLGGVKITPTIVKAGEKVHNVVPALVDFVLDVRINEYYTNEEVFEQIKEIFSEYEVTTKGFDLRSSSIPLNHPLVRAGTQLGTETYGSPTLSDMAALSCPSLKLGPGDSTRSHSADEFIYIDEIKEAMIFYKDLLTQFLKS